MLLCRALFVVAVRAPWPILLIDLLIDVRVNDALAPTYDGSLSHSFAVAASDKKRKYEQMSRELGSTVVPFVVDAFGALDREAVELVHADR